MQQENTKRLKSYSVASTTPCSLIPKEASPSGRQGESTTLQIRVVPLPFFKRNLLNQFEESIPGGASMRHNITADGL